MASSTLHGLLTWPEMQKSLVPALFLAPKPESQAAPRRSAAPSFAFLLLMLSAGFGVSGIVYVALGPKADRWGARFEAWFTPDRLTWRQAWFIIGLGAGLLLLTGAWYLLLR